MCCVLLCVVRAVVVCDTVAEVVGMDILEVMVMVVVVLDGLKP